MKTIREELIISALNGLTSNSFLAQQLAVLDLTTTKKIDPHEVLGALAVKIADAALRQMEADKP